MQGELDKLAFFAKPKLALDAVGGTSAVRLAESLGEVCCSNTNLLSLMSWQRVEFECCKSVSMCRGAKWSSTGQCQERRLLGRGSRGFSKSCRY
jgi:hypothetical protein